MRVRLRPLVFCLVQSACAVSLGCGDDTSPAPQAPANAVAPGKAVKAKTGAGGGLSSPPPPPAKR